MREVFLARRWSHIAAFNQARFQCAIASLDILLFILPLFFYFFMFLLFVCAFYLSVDKVHWVWSHCARLWCSYIYGVYDDQLCVKSNIDHTAVSRAEPKERRIEPVPIIFDEHVNAAHRVMHGFELTQTACKAEMHVSIAGGDHSFTKFKNIYFVFNSWILQTACDFVCVHMNKCR